MARTLTVLTVSLLPLACGQLSGGGLSGGLGGLNGAASRLGGAGGSGLGSVLGRGSLNLGDASTDVSDLLYSGGSEGLAQRPGADSFGDEDLDAGQRRQRMRACFVATQRHMKDEAAEVETAIAGMVAQGEAAAAAAGSSGRQSRSLEVSEEQAAGQLHFAMMMSCYTEIDQSWVDLVHKNDGQLPSKAAKEALFKHSSSPPRPTRQQYMLLESVMKEEQLERSQQVAMDPDGPGSIGIIGRGMSSSMKAFYVSVVIAGLCAAAYWAWQQVIPAQYPLPRQRTEKAAKRINKTAKQLDKKRFA